MSKYTYEWTEQKYQKWLKQGRGQGRGEEYKPWITIYDFSSKGKVSRAQGWNSNRVFQFMSKNELSYFYILQWCDWVVDIREQYPLLDIDAARHIAEELGVKYPIDNKTGVPRVLTTDFMVTINIDGQKVDVARTVKPAQDLEDKRVLEKFEIERRYWAEQNIDWGIVTEKDLPDVLVRNITWVHGNYEEINDVDSQQQSYFKGILKQKLAAEGLTVGAVLAQVDKELNMGNGSSLSLLKHLIARKEIIVDMEKVIDINSPTTAIKEIRGKDGKVKAV